MVMKKYVGAALMAALLLTGCQSSGDRPIKSGKIIGKFHDDRWIETVGIPDPSESGAMKYQQEVHEDCWRISFTADGELAYACLPAVDWRAYQVGDTYRYEGRPSPWSQ
jgi:hypothetical protein